MNLLVYTRTDTKNPHSTRKKWLGEQGPLEEEKWNSCKQKSATLLYQECRRCNQLSPDATVALDSWYSALQVDTTDQPSTSRPRTWTTRHALQLPEPWVNGSDKTPGPGLTFTTLVRVTSVPLSAAIKLPADSVDAFAYWFFVSPSSPRGSWQVFACTGYPGCGLY